MLREITKKDIATPAKKANSIPFLLPVIIFLFIKGIITITGIIADTIFVINAYKTEFVFRAAKVPKIITNEYNIIAINI